MFCSLVRKKKKKKGKAEEFVVTRSRTPIAYLLNARVTTVPQRLMLPNWGEFNNLN